MFACHECVILHSDQSVHTETLYCFAIGRRVRLIPKICCINLYIRALDIMLDASDERSKRFIKRSKFNWFIIVLDDGRKFSKGDPCGTDDIPQLCDLIKCTCCLHQTYRRFGGWPGINGISTNILSGLVSTFMIKAKRVVVLLCKYFSPCLTVSAREAMTMSHGYYVSIYQ